MRITMAQMYTLQSNLLQPVTQIDQIPQVYRNTPIQKFVEYNNLNRPFDTYTTAELLIGMCMDNRNHLRVPENFTYIIRSGGANLRYSDFKVAYSIGVGGISAIALLGHNNCGMSGIVTRRDAFIQGMVQTGGWDKQRASEYFDHMAPMSEIGNEIEFVVEEAHRLRRRYPKVIVAPMLYRVEDNKVYFIKE